MNRKSQYLKIRYLTDCIMSVVQLLSPCTDCILLFSTYCMCIVLNKQPKSYRTQKTIDLKNSHEEDETQEVESSTNAEDSIEVGTIGARVDESQESVSGHHRCLTHK